MVQGLRSQVRVNNVRWGRTHFPFKTYHLARTHPNLLDSEMTPYEEAILPRIPMVDYSIDACGMRAFGRKGDCA